VGDLEVLALVEVDGAAVDGGGRPGAVDGADDLAGVGGHGGDRGAAGVADVDVVGLAATRPRVELGAAAAQGPLGLQGVGQGPGPVAPQPLQGRVGQGGLEGGRTQVRAA